MKTFATEEQCRKLRVLLVDMHFRAKAAHLGTSLSEVEVLCDLYAGRLQKRDHFVLSKGHGASGLYAALHLYGLMDRATLDTYYTDGTLLTAHPSPFCHPNISVATGSLGQGVGVATGMAWAMKQENSAGIVYVLISDGECNEGSVWEAMNFASHHKLGALRVIVDANGFQGFGSTAEVLHMEPLAQKFEAFGCVVTECNGNSLASLAEAYDRMDSEEAAKPKVLLARTVKGKGLSFFENRLDSHYRSLSPEMHAQALRDLGES